MTHRMSVSVAAAFVKKSSLHATEYMNYILESQCCEWKINRPLVHPSMVTQPPIHHARHTPELRPRALKLVLLSGGFLHLVTRSFNSSSACIGTVPAVLNLPEENAACHVALQRCSGFLLYRYTLRKEAQHWGLPAWRPPPCASAAHLQPCSRPWPPQPEQRLSAAPVRP